MRNAHPAACAKAGICPKEVDRIARGLEKYGKQADALGLQVFGGSGSGTLRTDDMMIVATLYDFHVDGGDGGEHVDADGILWGET